MPSLPPSRDRTERPRRYDETKAWADELDENIEKTDRPIDDVVYELYGLTDQEIEIVEEADGG